MSAITLAHISVQYWERRLRRLRQKGDRYLLLRITINFMDKNISLNFPENRRSTEGLNVQQLLLLENQLRWNIKTTI